MWEKDFDEKKEEKKKKEKKRGKEEEKNEMEEEEEEKERRKEGEKKGGGGRIVKCDWVSSGLSLKSGNSIKVQMPSYSALFSCSPQRVKPFPCKRL